MKVLVTGGTGFIGRSVAKLLVKRGEDVAIFDNGFRSSVLQLGEVASSIEFIGGDIRDLDAIERAARGREVIYHLACINGTELFYKIPNIVTEVAILGTYNAIVASVRAEARRFVLASSSEVYQTPGLIPTPEDIELRVPDVHNPRYSYGGGKIASELLTVNLLRNSGPEYVIFRPHNVYGPDMGFEHVIPQLCMKLRRATREFSNASAEVEIQGTGEETRAFCHIDDAVRGIAIVGDRGSTGEIYNVGVQQETTIRDLAYTIAAVRGVDLRIRAGEAPSGGALRRCPDISKLARLGYSPQVSISAGISVTAEWYFTHSDLSPKFSKEDGVTAREMTSRAFGKAN